MKTTLRLIKTKPGLCLLVCLMASLIAASSIYLSISEASAADKRKADKTKTKPKQSPNRGDTASQKEKLPATIEPEDANRLARLITPFNPFEETFDQWINSALSPSGWGADTETPGKEESKKADAPDKAAEYYLKKRLPEGETELPLERYVEAMEQMQQMPVHSTADNRLVSREDLKANSIEQNKLGTWTWLGPGNIGGRTRSIVFNPQNPNTIYAGGVSGGVWKSTDAGLSWTPLGDLFANIPVSSLALQPNNPNVIYAGTGEGFEVGSQNGVNITGAHRGLGIYKSADAGATWMRLPGTGNSDFYYVNDLVISTANPQRVYAGTSTGVWRSENGGANWTRVFAPTQRGGCLDLAIRTDLATDTVFASCGTLTQATVYRNADAGGTGTWDSVLSDPGMGRTALSIAPSNQNVIYALSTAFTGTFSNSLHAVFRSTTGGASGSWQPRVRNTDPNKLNRAILSNAPIATAIDCKLGTTDSISGQGWYDLAIAVDPADENRVWTGGIDVARSDDGGANWGIAGFAYDYNTGSLSYSKPNQLHPDQHIILFHPQYNGTTNQQMFIGNDGGVWRTDNARAKVATGPTGACNSANSEVKFTPLNNNYGVTQFYHGSVAPDGKTYFGGAQDNGTSLGTDSEGPNKWKQVVLADGGYTGIDFINPATLYASTQGGGYRKSTDGGATFSPATLGLSGSVLFIAPLAMDPSNPQRLYAVGTPIFRTDNGMANWTNIGLPSAVTGTNTIMTAAAVAPTDANYALFGLIDGSIIRTTRALSLNPTTPLSATLDRAVAPRAGYVSWVAFDPLDKNIAYATYSTFGGGAHVWRTTNGGTSWTGIDGTGTTGIPDIPVHCIVVDTSNSARIYVGTDLGVFMTLDGGATWAVENTGFANVVTESLTLNTAAGVTSLYAFTHGRGAFKVTASMNGCNFSLDQTGTTVAAAGADLTVNVNVTPNGCSWGTNSNATWVTVQPGANGSASGMAKLKVAANTSFDSRIGTVAIAGRSYTVTQPGQPDIESPKIAITNPTTPTVNTTLSIITVSGTASDNFRLASLTWRTSAGVTGGIGVSTTGAWVATAIPLVTGVNVITFTATDSAGNAASASLAVNAKPDSLLVTVAGSGFIGFDRDNVQATAAGLTSPWRIAFDSAGNMFIADDAGARVRKVAPNGIITTIAGTGVSGFSGDGGPATSAQLNLPSGVAIDKDNNLYIADFLNSRVRKITAATGVITTIAGTGVPGYGGDGGQSTLAVLNRPDSATIGKDGNLYIADTSNHRVRRVNLSTGVITTVAGNGIAGFTADGGDATATAVGAPVDLAFDSTGNLYIASATGNRIRKVTLADGKISTVAGNGSTTFNGDGNTGVNTALFNPQGVAIDAANNIYINERGNLRIRRVNASDQRVSTLAGGSVLGFSPDGSGAIGARLSVIGIAVDPAGKLFFADTGNARVRTIISGVAGDTIPPLVQITAPTNTATLTTTTNPLSLSGTASDSNGVAFVRWSNDRGGNGQASGAAAWSIPVVTLQPGLNNLTVTAWDASGNAGSAQLAVTYTVSQVILTIAGTGVIGDKGDGGPGTAAELFQPRGVAIDSKGNVYIADTQNRRVRKVSPTGQITAFVGVAGSLGSGGDGGPAVDGTLNFPNVVIVDKADNVYISDQLANTIRKVSADGKISTIAGTGEGFGGFSGDGGQAKAAQLNGQVGLAFDNSGNLFIADRLNQRIRRIDGTTGVITTIAGTGFAGFSGDGGLATEAMLNLPTGVAVDGAGNVYIADIGNQRIRRINASDGKISTFAGTGVAGFSGDGGQSASALINLAYPATMTVDAMGDLYFADRNNQRIRKITLGTGVITTVAGTGFAGYNGDGTAAGASSLSFPTSVAFDSAGNMLIADSGNNRVRRVRPASSLRTVSSVSAASFSMTAGLAAEEIAVAFGMNLATSTVAAPSLPLPTVLAGTTVKVRDNLGVERLAPLFFASGEQINFLVPSGTASGLATVTVTNAAGDVAIGTVNISSVAPGLFTANSSGSGLAAAVVFRRTAAGRDSYEPVVRFDTATNRFVAVPIDLSVAGDQVFLIPYGTGFRGLSGLAGVSATVGGVNAPAVFAGAVPGFLGLDQVNLRLDSSLAGRGEVDVVLTVDGRVANTVRVAFR